MMLYESDTGFKWSSGKARPQGLGGSTSLLAFYLKRNPSNSSPSPRCCLYHRMLAQHSPDSPRPTVHRERAPNSLVPGPSGWCFTHIPLPPAAISHLLSSRSRAVRNWIRLDDTLLQDAALKSQDKCNLKKK